MGGSQLVLVYFGCNPLENSHKRSMIKPGIWLLSCNHTEAIGHPDSPSDYNGRPVCW